MLCAWAFCPLCAWALCASAARTTPTETQANTASTAVNAAADFGLLSDMVSLRGRIARPDNVRFSVHDDFREEAVRRAVMRAQAANRERVPDLQDVLAEAGLVQSTDADGRDVPLLRFSLLVLDGEVE